MNAKSKNFIQVNGNIKPLMRGYGDTEISHFTLATGISDMKSLFFSEKVPTSDFIICSNFHAEVHLLDGF